MAYKVKRVHRAHLYEVSKQMGISERSADMIVKAYLQDLKESLQAGESVTVPGLFTISVKEYENGYCEVRGSVSATIKKEIRGY